MSKKVLIVGSGFYGAVCARELADAGHRCLVIEKRNHIGGNCFTRYWEQADCHEHVYGAHIFHTSSENIWSYINRFSAFNRYVNRVKAMSGSRVFSFPINLLTLHQIFGVRTPEEARRRVEEDCISCSDPQNMEEYCLATFGRKIYEVFFHGYTCKQWNREPKNLPASLARRVAIRFNYDDNYFSDRFQGIPIGGYTAIFEKLLSGIPVELGVDFLMDRDEWLGSFDHIIFSGPIDGFFGYSHGRLEYRTLRFETELLPTPDAQGNAVINHCERSVPYTRTYEHKHFDICYTRDQTVYTTEYPAAWGSGMPEIYPVNTEDNQTLLTCYQKLAQAVSDKVTFGGRLGSYRYYDMHQVIGAALKTARDLLLAWR